MNHYRLPSLEGDTLTRQVTKLQRALRQLVEQLNENWEDPAAQEAPQPQIQGDFSPIRCYPVGSVYLSAGPSGPQALFGGIWEQLPQMAEGVTGWKRIG